MTPYRVLTALPIYNEANHVADVLREVTQHAAELLVVDDGSSDEAPTLLKQQQAYYAQQQSQSQPVQQAPAAAAPAQQSAEQKLAQLDKLAAGGVRFKFSYGISPKRSS